MNKLQCRDSSSPLYVYKINKNQKVKNAMTYLSKEL